MLHQRLYRNIQSAGHHDLHLEFPERVADILDKAVRDGFFA